MSQSSQRELSFFLGRSKIGKETFSSYQVLVFSPNNHPPASLLIEKRKYQSLVWPYIIIIACNWLMVTRPNKSKYKLYSK